MTTYLVIGLDPNGNPEVHETKEYDYAYILKDVMADAGYTDLVVIKEGE